MREQLAAHRANPACAGCHAQMDQLGFALENFDGIGEWRELYPSGARVDASAQLPDGTKFDGPAELRKVLLQHSDEFLTTMTEKMLTYALGRGLEASDAPAVRKIKRDAARTNNRFASIIQGIVTSDTVYNEDVGRGRELGGWRDGDYKVSVATADVHPRHERGSSPAVPRRDAAGAQGAGKRRTPIRGNLLRERVQHDRLDAGHRRRQLRDVANPETDRGVPGTR